MTRARITDQSEKKKIISLNTNKKSRETKKKAKKYVKPSISSPVLNKMSSLSLDTKTIISDSKPNAAIKEDGKLQQSISVFRKHYVKNIADTIGDPNDIQFTLKQYWNNLPKQRKNISVNHHLVSE